MIRKKYDNFIEWNDRMIKKFDLEHYHKNPNLIIRFIEVRRVKTILKFLGVVNKEKVIEVGCGAGDILSKIRGYYLTGLDISQYILDIAQKNYPGIKFVLGNAENLPEKIRKNRYDKIICSELLEHTENPQKVLGEIKRIAKKESVIVISIPNEKLINKIKQILQRIRLFDLFFSTISKKMDEEWHIHLFDLAKLREMVKDNYIIKKIKRIPFWFLPLRYVVKLKLKNDYGENTK